MSEKRINYNPFPDFELWSNCFIRNESYWNECRKEYDELKGKAREYEIVKNALEYLVRACSFQTGVIENLYEDDRGITFTAAKEIAIWEAALQKKPKEVRSLVQAQLDSYDLVLDFATQKKIEKITEFWIRSLHQKIVAGQEVYRVFVESINEWQEHILPKGEYKKLENHVKQKNGTIHYYCPAIDVPIEMARFCENINKEVFFYAHPIIQAAYAHYAFVCIHPFSDGNGRVSRALASVYTYRNASVPILITNEKKNEYFEALEIADKGSYQHFIDFIFDRTIDSIKLVNESLKTAMSPKIDEAFANLQKLYVTQSGYSHDDIKISCDNLINVFNQKIEDYFLKFLGDQNKILKIVINLIDDPSNSADWGLKQVVISLSSLKPLEYKLKNEFIIIVEKNFKKGDVITLADRGMKYQIKVTMEDLYPQMTEALKMRLDLFVERVSAGLIESLTTLLNSKKK